MSEVLGQLFFEFVNTPCYEEHSEEVCLDWTWWGQCKGWARVNRFKWKDLKWNTVTKELNDREDTIGKTDDRVVSASPNENDIKEIGEANQNENKAEQQISQDIENKALLKKKHQTENNLDIFDTNTIG